MNMKSLNLQCNFNACREEAQGRSGFRNAAEIKILEQTSQFEVPSGREPKIQEQGWRRE
jgi:hypothetical protein